MQTLAVLADDTRRRILDLLTGGELPAGDIAGRFDISQPAVSRHLKVLREAGLVSVEVRAQQRIYSLDPEPLRELDDWLAGYRRFWHQHLDALGTEVARGRRPTKETP